MTASSARDSMVMVRDIFSKGAPRHLSYHTALVPKLAALFRWLRFSCLGIGVLCQKTKTPTLEKTELTLQNASCRVAQRGGAEAVDLSAMLACDAFEDHDESSLARRQKRAHSGVLSPSTDLMRKICDVPLSSSLPMGVSPRIQGNHF